MVELVLYGEVSIVW